MSIVKSASGLLLLCVVALGIHLFVLSYLGLDPFQHQIIAAYVANFVTALLILVVLMKAPPKLQNSLGFLFMGGSLLKFAVFFVYFFPIYKADGEVGKLEFSTFFIPYAVCLIFETKALIHKLSEQDEKKV